MRKFLVLSALLCVVVPTFVFAQTPVGKISGKVTDATTGKPLPAVNVIVEETGRGAATNANGEYTILDMPPGWYDVTVTMMGYKPMTHAQVKVTMDLTMEVNFELEPTIIKLDKPIEVVARRPIVERDVTTSVTYATAEEIRAMPAANIRDVLTLTPGVKSVGSGVFDVHIRGGRGGEEVYMIDGITIRDPYLGGFNATVPLLAIQEQAVYTGGFGAEYSAESGVISVATKEPGPKISGTIRYKTSDYSRMPKFIKEFGDSYNKEELQWREVYDYALEQNMKWYGYGPEMFHQGEFSLTGPIAGPLSFFVSGDIVTTKNRTRFYDENDNLLAPKNDARHTYLGRLMFKPIPTVKLKLGFYQSRHAWYSWGWAWRFVPNTMQDMKDVDRMLNANFTHLLSPTMFYEIKLSQHTYDSWWDIRGDVDEFGNDLSQSFEHIDSVEYWVAHVEPSQWYYEADYEDPRRRGQLRPVDPTDQFSSFFRARYHQEVHATTTGEANCTSQLTPMHEIRTGFLYKKYNLNFFNADVASGGNYYMQKHHTYPYNWAAYFRDKIEARGMVVNAGLRLDYFSSNTHYPADWGDPVTDPTNGGAIKDPIKAKPRWQLSPRLGISHPITANDVLHFTYGHYFEIPKLNYLVQHGETWYMYGAFGIYGNANMDVERTVSYEVGVEHAITRDFKIDASGFYKDITGLATTKQIFRGATDWYALYVNGDYGHARGLELTLKKRPSRAGLWAPISGTISYTFMIAKGRYSSAFASYFAVWANQRLMTKEHYLDWDERHAISANIDIRIPGVGTGINVVYRYGSGLPYTPPARDPYVQPVNEKRRPPTTNTDIKLIQPFEIGDNELVLFFDILNAFDKKNLININDIQWYEQYGDPEGRYHDPTVWGYRRRIRTGIEFKF
jgi:outer membrane receptor protein involved in Fe transport